jgi:hypothetical protein
MEEFKNSVTPGLPMASADTVMTVAAFTTLVSLGNQRLGVILNQFAGHSKTREPANTATVVAIHTHPLLLT